MLELVKRFMAKVNINGPIHPKLGNACWIWTAHCNVQTGYGAFGVGREIIGAHRVSWRLHRGTIPPGLNVLHACDVRPCVRPDHLFLGTTATNILDAAVKGRMNSKLSASDVREVQRLLSETTMLHKEIADRFGVCRATISHISTGRNWCHLKRT